MSEAIEFIQNNISGFALIVFFITIFSFWKGFIHSLLSLLTWVGSIIITIYSYNLDVEILPAYCNWTLIEALNFDKEKNTLVEPYLPNHQIGIVHFAGKNNAQIRNDKNFISKVKATDGSLVEMKLRFNN